MASSYMTSSKAASGRLAGKAAFVTGGARGIGAAIVQRLAQEGADVTFTYTSNEAAARALAAKLEGAGNRVTAIRVDSANTRALSDAIDQAAAKLSRIDIMVNNAGVNKNGSVEQFSLADLDATLDINVRAVFVGTQAAVRHMPDGGRVVTIGSINAERMPFAGGAAYSMSKAAIVGLTKGLARDLGARQITVNNIQPGPVDTDLNPANGPMASALLGLMALKRYGHANEIAAMVAYLVGPEAGYVTGASLSIDGGFGA